MRLTARRLTFGGTQDNTQKAQKPPAPFRRAGSMRSKNQVLMTKSVRTCTAKPPGGRQFRRNAPV